MALRLVAFGLLALAACGGRPRVPSEAGPGREELWIVARSRTPRRAQAPVPPALLGRPTGSTLPPAALEVVRTDVAVAVVGPLVAVTHRHRSVPVAPTDAFVAVAAGGGPALRDFVLRVGQRTALVSVRAPDEADALYQEAQRAGRAASLFTTDRDGRVVVPVGGVEPGANLDLSVETVSIARWHDQAYEITVPPVAGPEDATLTIDLDGGGPLVVVSSPSHAIDTEAAGLDRVRVRPRDPAALREAFVLRYRAEADGALLVRPEGSVALVGLLVHPQERNHEPVALANVAIDWGAMHVLDIRPSAIGTLAAGAPLVVLAHVQGPTGGPVTVTGRAGGSPRTLAIDVAANPPAEGLRALPVLWARAAPTKDHVARRSDATPEHAAAPQARYARSAIVP